MGHDSSVKMLYLIDTISHAVTPVAFDADPQFRLVAVDSVSRTAWTTNADDSVSAIDMPGRTVTATIKVGRNPYGVAVDAAMHTVWVTNIGDDSVSMIDMPSRAVTGTVPIGDEPYGVVVDTSTHKVWVANMQDAVVSVIAPPTR
jgi:serine/threonine protein kinase, bacterial